jgi:eukaryotic-like serine/threonine-protein kinase
VIAGRYTLDREVGRGGMGAVWLGEDTVLHRVVAIKRIGMAPGATSPDLVRAEREARLAARLNHPHVVAVFDLVDDGDAHWLVMEYVEHVTLSELIRRQGRLAPDETAAILSQAAEALAAAHAAGIVHRDVKPSNILVTPDGTVKLTDFGIARAEADVTLTHSGLVTGSPAYLAPEVASGGRASEASDVWSLGATLYHALSGTAPYDAGGNILATMYQIVHDEPPRLPDAGWLTTLLTTTMEPDPDRRWSMAEVRDYLDRGGRGRPRPAPTPWSEDPATTQVMAPASPAEKSRPRRPALPLVAGFVALVAALLIGWALVRDSDQGSTGDRQPPASGPSASPSGGKHATAAGMTAFVQDYLATVTSDPAAAWQRLTPQFQRESGGYGKYSAFWDTVESASPTHIVADPGDLTVSYDVRYEMHKGHKTTDHVTLQLAYADDRYLISGED